MSLTVKIKRGNAEPPISFRKSVLIVLAKGLATESQSAKTPDSPGNSKLYAFQHVSSKDRKPHPHHAYAGLQKDPKNKLRAARRPCSLNFLPKSKPPCWRAPPPASVKNPNSLKVWYWAVQTQLCSMLGDKLIFNAFVSPCNGEVKL